MIGRYQTARAFRAALEDRLKRAARIQGVDLMRLRRQIAFDRLLARLFASPDAPWLLKGGYAFELRLSGSARATKDIDLSVPDLRRLTGVDDNLPNATDAIRERLQKMAAANLGDGFDFLVGRPMSDLDAAPYGGARYPIEARLDARRFATFHLDVGIGDAVVGELEWLTGPDMLGFAGIPPVRVAALAREQQFAEKLHAYTLPRGDRTNTRVKDLVDLNLLIGLGFRDAEALRLAIRATFARRGTHAAPATLEPPPDEWRAAYTQIATELALSATTLAAAYAQVAAYWEALQPLD